MGVDQPWAEDVSAVATALATDVDRGLPEGEASARLDTFGRNELVDHQRHSPWGVLARQFANTMILVLAAAAVITAFVGDLKDTIVIGAIVVINAVIGFAQEYRAEQAMAALRRLAADSARVLRDGVERTVPAPELAPGDVVSLAAGDMVPADVRLFDVQALQVNEAPLTGESEPVAKTGDALSATGAGGGLAVADRRNIAHKGTAVTYGRARGVVIATGMATELGRIADLLQSHPSVQTPLQRRLATLGRWLAAAALVVCVVVFTVGVARGEPAEEMFLTAVSLAVAAIPEGLPAVVTVALALGARRMAARHALVRKLPAVETLGTVSVICTDKTGTLTENRMRVERVWTPAGEYTVEGTGYEPAGVLRGPMEPPADAHLMRAAWVAAACNDASLRPPPAAGGEWQVTGDPTEGALLAFAGALGVDRRGVARGTPRVAEVAFESARRLMTTLHEADGQYLIAVKGALEAIAPLLAADDRGAADAAAAASAGWAAAGWRVIALADRRVPTLPVHVERVEHDLRLVAIVAITDPPRAQVRQAVQECKAAGIRPVMITGDHLLTASAIARRLGIAGPGDETITGTDLDAIDDSDLRDRVASISVYARTSPEQKLRIVDAWKSRGAIVAMTGDGVNDAPALRRADIGVAMGIIGSDVSKEAADMVLADDDFTTIVHAVEEGRRIYDNIRRFVRYLLTTNLGEVLVMFLAPLFGLPVPLLPVQILWVNLVTDGLPAIALGLERAEPDTMRRPPRPPTESILSRGLWQHAVWVGAVMAAVVIPIQAIAREAGWHWPTLVFSTLALLQLGHALAIRSETQSFVAMGPMSNRWLLAAVVGTMAVQLAIVYVPVLQGVFGTEALGVAEFAVVTVASTTVFFAVEIEKWVRRRR